jgi:hypothetical protein
MHCWSPGSVGQLGEDTHVTIALEEGHTVAIKAPVLKEAPISSSASSSSSSASSSPPAPSGG